MGYKASAIKSAQDIVLPVELVSIGSINQIEIYRIASGFNLKITNSAGSAIIIKNPPSDLTQIVLDMFINDQVAVIKMDGPFSVEEK